MSLTKLLSIFFAEPSLFMYYFQYLIGLRPDVTIAFFFKRSMLSPRYCDFLLESVVNDGIKTLGLH